MVIPDSKLFSGYPNPMQGVQRIVRVLAEDFGLVPKMLAEYKLTPERLRGAKLIIVPDPQIICDSASDQLYRASQEGAKILFTGAVEGNQYGKRTAAFRRLGLNDSSLPVSHYEETHWGSKDKDGRDLLRSARSRVKVHPPSRLKPSTCAGASPHLSIRCPVTSCRKDCRWTMQAKRDL